VLLGNPPRNGLAVIVCTPPTHLQPPPLVPPSVDVVLSNLATRPFVFYSHLLHDATRSHPPDTLFFHGFIRS